MAFFSGILVNEVINMALKYIVKAMRPCRRKLVVFYITKFILWMIIRFVYSRKIVEIAKSGEAKRNITFFLSVKAVG